jgi:uncharacterized protein (TIGR02001 family)
MTLGHTKLILLASAATFLLAAAPVRAADVSAPVVVKDKHDWDVAFGVTFTSDYISRGYTQTDGGAAVQPWAELTINDCFYVGYWGSNVGSGATSGWESDLSIGVRPKWGPVSFDFGYVRYLYSNSAFSADSSDIYAKASFSPFEPLTLGGQAFYNLDNKNTYLEANASVALHANISASAAVGWNTYGNGAPSDSTWNAGLSWAPQEWVKLDGRYYNGPTANKFVVSLSLSSSLKSLGVIK